MSEEYFYDPCKDCKTKEKAICATCEYGSLNEEQRRELATREYYGYDVK